MNELAGSLEYLSASLLAVDVFLLLIFFIKRKGAN